MLCWDHPYFTFDVCCLKSEQLTLQPNPYVAFETTEKWVDERSEWVRNIGRGAGMFWQESRIHSNKNGKELCHWIDSGLKLYDCIDILPVEKRKKYYDEHYVFLD